eukprot:SAG11_NODE_1194_length_5548_cov_3.456414_5_plen_88_part_00
MHAWLHVQGDEMHLKTARRFNAWVFTARLAAGEDDLSLLPFPHANFHLPEVVGMARAYGAQSALAHSPFRGASTAWVCAHECSLVRN